MSRAKHEIPKERAREIIELAGAIADEHCPTGKVDPEVIIHSKEICLVYDHYGDEFDGMLEYEGGRFCIHCNLDRENLQGSPRGRFTLGHELGHYFINEHSSALISGHVQPHSSFADKPSGDLLIEREADLFASHLLMPPARFATAVPRARKGLSGIQDIAAKFNVSLTCAAIRYVADEVEPGVLIKWSSDGSGWRWLSAQFRARNYGATISEIRDLPTDSSTQMCLSVGQARSGVIGKKTALAGWFPTMPTPCDLIVREEAMTLGRFGVLTLLTLPSGRFPQECGVRG